MTRPMISVRRRPFLAGLAVTTTVAVARPGAAVARAATSGVIDVHAHALPDWWRSTLPDGRASGVPAPRWSAAKALRYMDRHRIATQVLSLPDPAVSHLPDAAARLEAAVRANDELAALSGSSRGRFAGLAVVPLGPEPTPDEVLSAGPRRPR